MQKFGEVIEMFFPREPLSQDSSDLNESFLTYCRFKRVQIMVPKGQGGGLFLHVCIEKNLLKWKIWQISIKLGTNISLMKGIKVYPKW
jgi:hypothetical protein